MDNPSERAESGGNSNSFVLPSLLARQADSNPTYRGRRPGLTVDTNVNDCIRNQCYPSYHDANHHRIKSPIGHIPGPPCPPEHRADSAVGFAPIHTLGNSAPWRYSLPHGSQNPEPYRSGGRPSAGFPYQPNHPQSASHSSSPIQSPHPDQYLPGSHHFGPQYLPLLPPLPPLQTGQPPLSSNRYSEPSYRHGYVNRSRSRSPQSGRPLNMNIAHFYDQTAESNNIAHASYRRRDYGSAQNGHTLEDVNIHRHAFHDTYRTDQSAFVQTYGSTQTATPRHYAAAREDIRHYVEQAVLRQNESEEEIQACCPEYQPYFRQHPASRPDSITEPPDSNANGSDEYNETPEPRSERSLSRTVSAASFHSDHEGVPPFPVDPPVVCTFPNCDNDTTPRKSISHFFGRNKKVTACIPDWVYPARCRRHYQRTVYSSKKQGSLHRNQYYLIKELLVAIDRYFPGTTYAVHPAKMFKDAINRSNAALAAQSRRSARGRTCQTPAVASNSVATNSATARAQEKERKMVAVGLPIIQTVQHYFYDTNGGQAYPPDTVIRILRNMSGQMDRLSADDRSIGMPQVEFLPVFTPETLERLKRNVQERKSRRAAAAAAAKEDEAATAPEAVGAET